MKIPTDKSDISKWLELCKNGLSEFEPHHIKRVGLMGIAFSGKSFSGKSDGFSANDYSDEKAASLFEAANAGDADAQCALCIVASLLLETANNFRPIGWLHTPQRCLGREVSAKPPRRPGRYGPHDKTRRNITANPIN